MTTYSRFDGIDISAVTRAVNDRYFYTRDVSVHGQIAAVIKELTQQHALRRNGTVQIPEHEYEMLLRTAARDVSPFAAECAMNLEALQIAGAYR